MKSPYRAHFWGVRGSVPTPGPEYLRYGGNTSCLGLELSSRLDLVFDAGTGIRLLGNHLIKIAPKGPREVHLFLTHYHLDHVQGLPFFAPLHRPETRMSFHGHRPEGGGLRELLERLVSPPLFPAALAEAPSRRAFLELGEGSEPFRVDDLTVTPIPLHHPDRATGYRVDREGGASFVYATDHEHGDEAVDSALQRAVTGAGVLIVDAHFTPEEHEKYRGWGHGTWRRAAELARSAGVGRLVLFHHLPFRSDAELDRIVAAAREIFPATDAAREGMEFEV